MNTPPKYENVLPTFLGDLRSRLFSSQGQAAEYFGIRRPTVNRYENGVYRPPLGYLVSLMHLLVKDQPSDAEARTYRQQLLADANQVIRDHYQGDNIYYEPFTTWEELRAVADDYLAEQRPDLFEQAETRADQNEDPDAGVSTATAKVSSFQQNNVSVTPVDPAVAPEGQDHHLLRNMPIPTYSHLFGIQLYADKLLTYLLDRQQHPIISIQGIGGMGKTALADYVTRKFVSQVDFLHDLVWVSAKQEFLTEAGIVQNKTQVNLESLFDDIGQKLELPQVLRLPLRQKIECLAQVLRAKPYMVVIDNLETIQDFQGLVPWLEKLAAPTKFLLTSREAVPALRTVTLVRLAELTEAASFDLIEAISQEKQVPHVEPRQIYGLVGGHPLAIILLISQMQYLPPDKILANIKLGTQDEIYRYVYQKGWIALPDDGRKLLLAIQRAGDQANWEWLSTVLKDFSDQDIQDALRRLINLSLVQPQYSQAHGHYYMLHRLTSTFLRTEVLGWK